MSVRSVSYGKRKVTTKDVWAKPANDLSVPLREIDAMESIVLGFRSDMLSITDDKGNGGVILTTSGFGGDAVILQHKDGKKKRQAVLRGSDLLIAWIATFDPKAAERMREVQP